MTLARGDVLGKLNKETGERIPSTQESYTEWEIVDLTTSNNLAGYVGSAKASALGQEVINDVYQIVFLRKRA